MTARTLAALALALLLTACGGGDWEDDTKDAGARHHGWAWK